jgi:hypothetical protein
LGYGTQFTEDFDFAEGDPGRVVDSPVDRSVTRGGAARNGGAAGGAELKAEPKAGVVTLNPGHTAPGFSRGEQRPVLPATEPQIKAIYAIARGAQAMDDAEVEAKCVELYGVPPSGLTRRQASEFIDVLKSGANN